MFQVTSDENVSDGRKWLPAGWQHHQHGFVFLLTMLFVLVLETVTLTILSGLASQGELVALLRRSQAEKKV
jgi:hypothetical protein